MGAILGFKKKENQVVGMTFVVDNSTKYLMAQRSL